MTAKFEFNWTIITGIISYIVTSGVFLWKLSAWKTRLTIKIEQNKQDINNLGNSIREKIDRENYYQNVQIQHIARFLEETTAYRHPTMGGFEDELSRNKR